MKKKLFSSSYAIILYRVRVPFILLFLSFYYSAGAKENSDYIGLQVNVVTGVIKSEAGISLEGVSVIIKDQDKGGGISNSAGEYKVEVPVNGILIFSSTGFLSQEVNVGDKKTINIILKPDVKGLEEVVIVGYGSQKRRDITGSVASVSKERLEMVPNLNIAQALQGAVPGIMIQQTQAGAVPNQSIMIRGRNSILASNDPLIVVDGIPYSGGLMDINPNDVKSIEVLKDASAAAIYGSRGANGVILVTTKLGQTGKPRISYDGRYSTQKAVNVPKFMSGQDFYDFKEIREPGKVTASEQAVYNSGKWVDWVDLALHNGRSQQHNLSVAGGFQNTNYLLGGSFLDANGVAINDGYRRITSRINIETEITKWLKIGTRTQLSFEKKRGFPLDWVLMFRKNPLTKAYDDDGNLTLYPWPEFIDIRNPLEPINYDYTNESNQILTNNFAIVKVPFIEGLTYQLNTGIRRKSGSISNYIGRNTAAGLEARGIANTASTSEKNNIVENVLSFNRDIGDHTIFATAAYMYEENSSSANIVDARGFPNDFTSYYSTSQASFIAPSYAYAKTVLISQMLRLNYSFQGRYLLTLTGRRDGYSGFGAKSKWGTFPSVAVGWNLGDEEFFPLKNLFNKFKLRASYGVNGNQAVGAYETISRYAESNIVALGVTQPGYIPSRIGLDNLGWESSKSLNVGLDFGILKNRIEGDFNFYKTKTIDLLLNRSISSVNGLTSITQNIGETENIGIEFSVSSRNIVTNNFTWSTTANMAHVKNRITSLYGLLDANGNEIDDQANSWFIGQPVRVNFNYVFDGVWQQDESVEAATWGSVPGNAKIRDTNKDGIINASDRQVIGQLDPKFLW
ncbi:MAG: SusC/RagA family TonB-linked outer membrane protein, partial [Flavitalea sp.]